MESHELAKAPQDAELATKQFFTVEQANQALPYVSRIVRDIVTTYGLIRQLQRRIGGADSDDGLRELEQDHQQQVARLNELVDELHDVGVELKDVERGLVDFPAMHQGREICICWQLDEPRIVAWHEPHAGFAGRQAIEILQLN